MKQAIFVGFAFVVGCFFGAYTAIGDRQCKGACNMGFPAWIELTRSCECVQISDTPPR